MKTIREIRIRDLITYFLIPLLVITLIWVGFAFFAGIIPHIVIKITLVIVLCAVTYILLRPFVIGCVLAYKAFAPREMRERCRFEPTCSTYMIMAIKKYGLIKGVFKGIRRITRCKPPNGGIDYP